MGFMASRPKLKNGCQQRLGADVGGVKRMIRKNIVWGISLAVHTEEFLGF